MARSRGRSSGGLSRAPKKSKSPTPVPSPAKAPAPSRLPTGPTNGLGSVVAEGMAFGAGNAVAHRAVDSVMGPRVIHLEPATPTAAAPPAAAPPAAAPPAAAPPAAAANTANLDACVGQYKAFQECLNTSANDIGRCQFYMNMLTECRKAGSSSGTLMA